MDGSDIRYKRGNVKRSLTKLYLVVFVHIFAPCYYALCSYYSYCLRYPLNFTSLRKGFGHVTLFCSYISCFECESHINNKYVITIRICNKRWKTKPKVHTKDVKLAFLMTTPSSIAVVNHSRKFRQFCQTGFRFNIQQQNQQNPKLV